ncbi:MAG: hypothetical protein DDT30_02109 [Dehalococcoidia bacterium]|nr:hypothetical protein [Bacillota bacterium]MBT9143996.1 hypothetical protein [Bacillota bacterium]
MIYVFDSSSLIDLFKYYYPNRFPSLWENFDALVLERRIISVREVRNELEGHGDSLSVWVKDHHEFFPAPTTDELNFVAKIFKVTHFQALVKEKEWLQGKPVADPFVIANAWALEEGCVVTQEVKRPNAAKIPNVCEHFGIPCLNLEAFMENEKWRF